MTMYLVIKHAEQHTKLFLENGTTIGNYEDSRDTLKDIFFKDNVPSTSLSFAAMSLDSAVHYR